MACPALSFTEGRSESGEESFKNQGLTEEVHQKDQDQVSATKRLVVLGKTGSGKSNLANTIFGEHLFETYYSANSGTHKCKAVTKCVNERTIAFIDTPGFFDTERPEGNLTSEIMRCFTECAPGPHAFLIVLKVEKYTEHEKDVIKKIYKCFSKEALKYAVVVFTHGDQLPEGKTIKEFVSHNKNLDELVKKCGGRCHVVDNKYWKDDKEGDYRSNRYQVAELLKTIDKIAEENDREYFTNDMLGDVKRQIETEEEHIRQSAGCEMSEEEITKTAKTSVFKDLLTRYSGVSSGVLLGAFLSVAGMVMSRRV
ncbi:GTPase IMAP family member 7-like [Mugil cephalus]|uniref:GTPase IMAP family member 7-like n=1 Tax=Mugil cephalus TaxID=48193 RepID=UPI001FB64EB1|nr:GTPase IMAP family member 7-like [Mugil cephalus]